MSYNQEYLTLLQFAKEVGETAKSIKDMVSVGIMYGQDFIPLLEGTAEAREQIKVHYSAIERFEEIKREYEAFLDLPEKPEQLYITAEELARPYSLQENDIIESLDRNHGGVDSLSAAHKKYGITYFDSSFTLVFTDVFADLFMEPEELDNSEHSEERELESPVSNADDEDRADYEPAPEEEEQSSNTNPQNQMFSSDTSSDNKNGRSKPRSSVVDSFSEQYQVTIANLDVWTATVTDTSTRYDDSAAIDSTCNYSYKNGSYEQGDASTASYNYYSEAEHSGTQETSQQQSQYSYNSETSQSSTNNASDYDSYNNNYGNQEHKDDYQPPRSESGPYDSYDHNSDAAAAVYSTQNSQESPQPQGAIDSNAIDYTDNYTKHMAEEEEARQEAEKQAVNARYEAGRASEAQDNGYKDSGTAAQSNGGYSWNAMGKEYDQDKVKQERENLIEEIDKARTSQAQQDERRQSSGHSSQSVPDQNFGHPAQDSVTTPSHQSSAQGTEANQYTEPSSQKHETSQHVSSSVGESSSQETSTDQSSSSSALNPLGSNERHYQKQTFQEELVVNGKPAVYTIEIEGNKVALSRNVGDTKKEYLASTAVTREGDRAILLNTGTAATVGRELEGDFFADVVQNGMSGDQQFTDAEVNALAALDLALDKRRDEISSATNEYFGLKNENNKKEIAKEAEKIVEKNGESAVRQSLTRSTTLNSEFLDRFYVTKVDKAKKMASHWVSRGLSWTMGVNLSGFEVFQGFHLAKDYFGLDLLDGLANSSLGYNSSILFEISLWRSLDAQQALLMLGGSYSKKTMAQYCKNRGWADITKMKNAQAVRDYAAQIGDRGLQRMAELEVRARRHASLLKGNGFIGKLGRRFTRALKDTDVMQGYLTAKKYTQIMVRTTSFAIRRVVALKNFAMRKLQALALRNPTGYSAEILQYGRQIRDLKNRVTAGTKKTAAKIGKKATKPVRTIGRKVMNTRGGKFVSKLGKGLGKFGKGLGKVGKLFKRIGGVFSRITHIITAPFNVIGWLKGMIRRLIMRCLPFIAKGALILLAVYFAITIILSIVSFVVGSIFSFFGLDEDENVRNQVKICELIYEKDLAWYKGLDDLRNKSPENVVNSHDIVIDGKVISSDTEKESEKKKRTQKITGYYDLESGKEEKIASWGVNASKKNPGVIGFEKIIRDQEGKQIGQVCNVETVANLGYQYALEIGNTEAEYEVDDLDQEQQTNETKYQNMVDYFQNALDETGDEWYKAPLRWFYQTQIDHYTNKLEDTPEEFLKKKKDAKSDVIDIDIYEKAVEHVHAYTHSTSVGVSEKYSCNGCKQVEYNCTDKASVDKYNKAKSKAKIIDADNLKTGKQSSLKYNKKGCSTKTHELRETSVIISTKIDNTTEEVKATGKEAETTTIEASDDSEYKGYKVKTPFGEQYITNYKNAKPVMSVPKECDDFKIIYPADAYGTTQFYNPEYYQLYGDKPCFGGRYNNQTIGTYEYFLEEEGIELKSFTLNGYTISDIIGAPIFYTMIFKKNGTNLEAFTEGDAGTAKYFQGVNAAPTTSTGEVINFTTYHFQFPANTGAFKCNGHVSCPGHKCSYCTGHINLVATGKIYEAGKIEKGATREEKAEEKEKTKIVCDRLAYSGTVKSYDSKGNPVKNNKNKVDVYDKFKYDNDELDVREEFTVGDKTKKVDVFMQSNWGTKDMKSRINAMMSQDWATLYGITDLVTSWSTIDESKQEGANEDKSSPIWSDINSSDPNKRGTASTQISGSHREGDKITRVYQLSEDRKKLVAAALNQYDKALTTKKTFFKLDKKNNPPGFDGTSGGFITHTYSSLNSSLKSFAAWDIKTVNSFIDDIQAGDVFVTKNITNFSDTGAEYAVFLYWQDKENKIATVLGIKDLSSINGQLNEKTDLCFYTSLAGDGGLFTHCLSPKDAKYDKEIDTSQSQGLYYGSTPTTTKRKHN